MEVDRFLTDLRFNETAPRPPVPGEENELISNGGNSTRSTGSHKTQSSGKSDKSSKSRSPAATPRRSNLDKSIHNLESKLNDEDAPLGFEPEGSETSANLPAFTENTTPPYKKWAESLRYLLEDGEGVKLYKHFLDQEHTANPLDFWFACRGLKLVQASNTAKIQSLSRLIYKKYIKGEQLKLDPRVKRGIAEKLKGERYDQSIFDDAQAHVEDVMRKDTYPLFLNSDIYVQYVQNGGESPKSGDSTGGSNSVRPVSVGPLPTVHEEKELQNEDIAPRGCGTGGGLGNKESPLLPLNPCTLAVTQPLRSAVTRSDRLVPRATRPERFTPGGAAPWRTAHARSTFPYHVSYAPTSERESENTSDAHTTDDAMSLTDSSIDGRDGSYRAPQWKKKHRGLRDRQMQANKNTGLAEQFIPRTERAPQNRNIAEKDPREFARLLSSKLERVVAEREKYRAIKELHLDGTDSESERAPAVTSHVTSHAQQPPRAELFLSLMDSKEDENAQSILEEHCNRIWDISRGETPTGRHSPDQSLALLRAGPSVASVLHTSLNMSQHTAPPTQPPKHHHHKKRDLASHSFASLDSGVSEDSRGYKHHSAHAHSSSFTCGVTSKEGKLEGTPRPAAYSYYTQHTAQAHSQSFSNTILYDDRTRTSKESRGHASKRGNAETDSGFNDSSIPPRASDPATNKVLAWMSDNEKLAYNNASYSTDGSDKGSSLKHDRHSHKSGSSKKSGGYSGASRSSAAPEHTKHAASYTSYHRSALPTQPISQDPSMPILTPPHTTVQLEEARRRLQDEHITKSRSVGGRLGEDKHLMPPPPIPARGLKHIPSTPSLPPPPPADTSHSESRQRLAAPPPVPPGGGGSADESIVAGYYFCSDPIPFRITVQPGCTLGDFKLLLAKKGNFKYFFKKASDEFETGIVYAEVSNDAEPLPLIEGKIVGKIERVE